MVIRSVSFPIDPSISDIPSPISATEGGSSPFRILSDLHLGHPGCRIGRVEELRPLLEGVPLVYFNGDTFELRKAALKEKVAELRAELEALCADCGATPVFMTGNHDPQVSEHHYFDLCDGRVFLTHGDFLYDDVSPWSKLLDGIHAERAAIRDEYPADYMDDLDLRIKAVKRIAATVKVRQVSGPPGKWGKVKTLWAEAWPPKRPYIILKTWATCHRLADQLRDQFRPQAKAIIMGHTHRAHLYERAGKHVINTGAFLALAKSFAVDVDGQKLTVREAPVSGGAFRLGRTRLELDLTTDG